MVIRVCRPEEHPAVLELWRRAEAPSSAGADLEGLAALGETQPEALLVAELDGSIAGSLIVTWDGWRGHLYRLAVLPEHRRRGVAAELVAEGERRLGHAGARLIHAAVDDRNRLGLDFWSAAGYELETHMRRFERAV